MATYTQLGLEMVVLRAGAAVSLISRITRGVGTLSDAAEEAAIASLRSSRAYKEVTNSLEGMTQAQQEAAEASLQLVEEQIRATVRTKQLHLALVLSAQAASYVVKGYQTLAEASIAVASAEQTQRKSTLALAKNYGVSKSTVESYVKAVKAQNFTRTEALVAIGKLATAEVDLASVVRLGAIANDIAAQRGLEAGDVLDILTTAITNQSYSSLNQIGITESAEIAFRRYASQIGQTREELDGQARSQAVLNTVLKKGAAFAGAYESVQEDLTWKTRDFTLELEELYEVIGQFLIPTVEAAVARSTEFLRVLNDLSPETKEFIISITAGVGAASALGVGLATLIPVVKLFVSAFSALGKLVGGPWVVAALLGITAIGTALTIAAKRRKDLAEELAEDLQPAEVDTKEEESFADSLQKRARQEDAYWRSAFHTRQIALAGEREDLKQQLSDIEEHRRGIEQEVQRLEDAVYKIDLREFFLDELLTPFENRLARITAEINKTLVPLQRRERLLRRELDAARDIADEEKERRQAIIDQLQAQIALVRELLEEDRDRLSLLDHELFMEGLRNKILKRATSAKELELRGQKAIQEDIVATRSEELATTRAHVKEEKAKLKAEENTAKALLKAAEKRLQAVQLDMSLQQEKITYAREELLLAEGRQVEDRIGLSILERRAELQSMMIGREELLLDRQDESLTRQLEIFDKEIAYIRDALDEEYVFDLTIALAKNAIPPSELVSTEIKKVSSSIDDWAAAIAQMGRDAENEAAELVSTQHKLIGHLAEEGKTALDRTLVEAGIRYDAWLAEQEGKSDSLASKPIGKAILAAFAPGRIKELIDAWYRAVIEPVVSPIPHDPPFDVPPVVPDVGATVKKSWGGIKDLWNLVYGLPTDIWSDILGIPPDVPGVIGKYVIDAWNDAIDIIKDEFDTESPSKKTAAVGKDIADGFEVGFKDGMAEFRESALLEIDRTADIIQKRLDELSIQVSPTAQVSLSPLLSQTARQGIAEARQASVVNNYYTTHQGAQIDFNAAYAKAQSPSSVLDDLQMITAVI